ncbi:MAG: hypothetical protein A3F14_00915 [Gammaproteobacteria bacterium RIFCSPHIGHO2_12_FULL_43_28]|nr:MAG: hypothetical protein A3F14_00915 [Gammaproteobacteria bacterium RIFCSPHIGHO2_12_FULL_43_28]
MAHHQNTHLFTSILASPLGAIGIRTQGDTLLQITTLPSTITIKSPVPNSYDVEVARELTAYFKMAVNARAMQLTAKKPHAFVNRAK